MCVYIFSLPLNFECLDSFYGPDAVNKENKEGKESSLFSQSPFSSSENFYLLFLSHFVHDTWILLIFRVYFDTTTSYRICTRKFQNLGAWTESISELKNCPRILLLQKSGSGGKLSIPEFTVPLSSDCEMIASIWLKSLATSGKGK